MRETNRALALALRTLACADIINQASARRFRHALSPMVPLIASAGKGAGHRFPPNPRLMRCVAPLPSWRIVASYLVGSRGSTKGTKAGKPPLTCTDATQAVRPGSLRIQSPPNYSQHAAETARQHAYRSAGNRESTWRQCRLMGTGLTQHRHCPEQRGRSVVTAFRDQSARLLAAVTEARSRPAPHCRGTDAALREDGPHTGAYLHHMDTSQSARRGCHTRIPGARVSNGSH
jgi:hypothetical protein